MNHPIKVLLPWNTSNFMPLNAFHPIYRFVIKGYNKTTSQLIRYYTFNERLLYEFMLFTDKGGALREYTNGISKKLGLEKHNRAEHLEIWDFFDINETLSGEVSGVDLQVIHTTPISVGIKPFIYHLESFETLFYPWTIHDPFLVSTSDKKIKSIIEYLKRLLESPQCIRIVSHLPSTLEKFKTVFKSDFIQKKLLHCPLGFPLLKKNATVKNSFRFIYTSSLHKNLNNLERRGIRIVFTFMKLWLEQYPEDEFILFVPPLEDHDFPGLGISEILSNPHVYNFGNQYVSDLEFNHILTSSDFILIPSLQLDSSSLLKSMGAGVIPVVLDLGTVQELGISPMNSIILDIFSKLDQTESPIFGKIPSLKDFNTQCMAIAELMIIQIEFLKRNPEKKTELSLNAQALIRERFDLNSASQKFSNAIIESIRKNSEPFSHGFLGPPEDLIPLRPVIPEDFDTVPLYRPFLDLGSLSIHSNGQHFLIDDYNHSKLRGYPSLLSNNNARESFMSDWEQNLMGLLNPGLSNKTKWKVTLKTYLRNFPRMKKFLKKIGINRIARKIGLI